MNGSILLIPGVNFLLIARYSILNEFSAGFYCALGVTSAIMSHVILSMFSVSVLIKKYPELFTIIRYIGGAYLFYLGSMFLLSYLKRELSLKDLSKSINIKKKEAFYSGFFTDLFNPFVSIFYLSLFSMLITDNKSSFELICYFCLILIITISWFGIVAYFFTSSFIRNYFRDKNKYMQVFSGMAMYYFGAKLIFKF